MTYNELKNLIGEGYIIPETKRNRGVCIHHSYKPEIPVKGKNYAEIFHKYHYKVNGWNNGLGYDFVISWWENGGIIDVKYWTSARWILQLNGAHALNTKKKKWKNKKIILPNRELMSICIVGDYDKHKVPDEVYDLINEIIDQSGVERNIFFHNDFDYKTCPGNKFDKGRI